MLQTVSPAPKVTQTKQPQQRKLTLVWPFFELSVTNVIENRENHICNDKLQLVYISAKQHTVCVFDVPDVFPLPRAEGDCGHVPGQAEL